MFGKKAAYLELLLYDKDSALVSSQAVLVGSSTFWTQIDGSLTASVMGMPWCNSAARIRKMYGSTICRSTTASLIGRRDNAWIDNATDN
ncbi:hypothetical protein AB9P05_05375 [Roseivirga sp. BDSF3-8]|uniref:hypothetical protein n=1 Tax=Roseivirga sp. BDSF3-8 TaxID=3241598 RepID=UPI003531AEC7